MPVDHHYVFAELNEDELKTLLPEDRLPEFLHEGKELTWEQVEELKLSGEIVAEDGRPLRDEQGEKIPGAKGKYQRPLYDYRELLAAFYRDRLILRDMIVSLEKDVGLLKDSAAEAKAILSAREEEIRKLAEQQATVRKERGAVWSHYQAVRQRVVALEQELNRLLEENRRLAAQLVQAQLQAAQQINARTSAMARSPEGGN
jgi:chromosome segregation ATPase